MQFTEEHKSIYVLVGIVLFPVFLLFSCVPLATDFKKSGLNESPKGFAALEKTPDLYEIFELHHRNRHTIGDGKHFKRDETASSVRLTSGQH